MLKDIIGQEKLKKYLDKEIQSNTLSHGYIIEGDTFMGKEYIARMIADEITVPSYVTRITPSNDRKQVHVDDIRELSTDAYTQSLGGAKKVYILPNADGMSNQAQNAFLKLLEEPPQDCVFIIICENRYNLLSTIRSRCTALLLSRYTDKDIRTYLATLGIDCNPEIIRLCNGTINRYLYLSSKEFADINELAYRVLLNIRKNLHSARIFAITKHLKKQKDYINDFLDIFLLWYRDIYVYKILKDENYIESVSKKSDIVAHSNDYEISDVTLILEQIEFCRTKLEYNCNFDMTIETLLLYMKGDVK